MYNFSVYNLRTNPLTIDSRLASLAVLVDSAIHVVVSNLGGVCCASTASILASALALSLTATILTATCLCTRTILALAVALTILTLAVSTLALLLNLLLALPLATLLHVARCVTQTESNSNSSKHQNDDGAVDAADALPTVLPDLTIQTESLH